MRNYDVAIIGAGPAGSAASILLARLGYAVALLDRARFPRDKVCGDYLTPGAVGLLRDEIGVLPALVDAGAAHVDRQSVVDQRGRSFTSSVNALSCPRRITDAVLVDAARSAGADVIEDFTVRDILFDGNRVAGVIGDQSGPDSSASRFGKGGEELAGMGLRARVTIGADGTHSLLARRLGVVRPIPRLHRLALSAYFTGDDPDLTMYLPVDGSLACCGFGPSTSAIGQKNGVDASVRFPQDWGLGGGLRNVNIVVPVSEAGQIAGRREDYFRRRLEMSFPQAWSKLDRRRIDGPVRSTACFGHRTTRAAFDGALLVGDAAVFIHPFTGEGVYYALEGARLAAVAIDRALRAGDTGYDRLCDYDHARRRVLLPRYRLCDAIQHIVHSPRLLSWLTPRLGRSPDLADAVLRAVGDIDTPSQLLRWVNFSKLCTLKT